MRNSSESDDVNRAGPLAGIRVLDLTRLLPGPMCTQHLSDFGAEVIKIEDTGAGDYARTLGPMRGDTSVLFDLVNRNKRGIRLDLKKPEGLAVLLRLAKTADILVEGFRPGVMDKLGAGHAAVSAVNPRIVYCSITGYGQDGPYAQRAGHDINYIGYAGVADQIGEAGGPPVLPNFQIADLLGGALVPAMGILAALVDAQKSGRGRHVDVAMADAVLAHAVFPLLDTVAEGNTPPRGSTMLAGGLPCYGYYATRDARHMAVGALEAKFWETLCDALGCPELKPQHLVYGDAAAPVKARLAAIFATRTQAEWTAHFAGIDCCVSPVLTMREALGNEQFRARGMVADGPSFAQPVKLGASAAPDGRSPAPGEHTDAVLGEAGFSAGEVAALRACGAIA